MMKIKKIIVLLCCFCFLSCQKQVEEIKLIEEVNSQITTAVNKARVMTYEYKQLIDEMEVRNGNNN